MKYIGIDTAARISADKAKILASDGISFVGRYLVPQSMSKALTAQEARGLHDAGLVILPVWEIDAAQAGKGASQGTIDGEAAKRCAKSLGIPESVAIFFAVDYNAPQRDYDAIEYYFRAAQKAVAPYLCGIYGSFSVVESIRLRVPNLKIWQCVAWSGGKLSPMANFYQYEWQGGDNAKALAAKVGFAVDLNRGANLDALWGPQEKHWYDETVKWAMKEGVVTEARPTDAATRAEVMQMIRNYHRRFEAEDPKTKSGFLEE